MLCGRSSQALHWDTLYFKQLPALTPTRFQRVRQPGLEAASIWHGLTDGFLNLAIHRGICLHSQWISVIIGPPFRWDEERRLAIRAELDAAYFHLYGIERDDVEYIMETFSIVKRKDVAALGSSGPRTDPGTYTTRWPRPSRTGKPYQTILDPPPGHGPRHPAMARPRNAICADAELRRPCSCGCAMSCGSPRAAESERSHAWVEQRIQPTPHES